VARFFPLIFGTRLMSAHQNTWRFLCVLACCGWASPAHPAVLSALSPDGTQVARVQVDDKGKEALLLTAVGGTSRTLAVSLPGTSSRLAFVAPRTLLAERRVDGRRVLLVIEIENETTRELTCQAATDIALLAVVNERRVLAAVALTHRGFADVFAFDLKTGQCQLDTVNPGDVTVWAVDADFTVRGATARLANGETEIRIKEGGRFRALVTASWHETLALHGFSLDGRSVFLTTSVSSNTTRLVEKTIATGAERILASNPDSDVVNVLIHPRKHVVEAVSFFENGGWPWTVLGWVRGDFEALQAFDSRNFVVLDRDQSDQHWLVRYSAPLVSAEDVVFTRETRSFVPLDTKRSSTSTTNDLTSSTQQLSDAAVLQMPLSNQSAPVLVWLDGQAFPPSPLRQATGQLFLNQPVAVLHVVLPGSANFGKRRAHSNARNWGAGHVLFVARHLELLDNVSGIDRTRIAIIGEGLAGTSAVAALGLLPDKFRCGVAIDAPLNLINLTTSLVSQTPSVRASASARLGDFDDPQGLSTLSRNSPLFLSAPPRALALWTPSDALAASDAHTLAAHRRRDETTDVLPSAAAVSQWLKRCLEAPR
jgi:dipeptidyl aminopeptidase/acylaminoacyl peptidase